jgi:predicted nuclease with TOPRIM domain
MNDNRRGAKKPKPVTPQPVVENVKVNTAEINQPRIVDLIEEIGKLKKQNEELTGKVQSLTDRNRRLLSDKEQEARTLNVKVSSLEVAYKEMFDSIPKFIKYLYGIEHSI